MKTHKYLSCLIFCLTLAGSNFAHASSPIKGDPADKIIAAIAAVVQPSQGNGENDYSVDSLKCDTPDGSNMDDSFASTCDLVVNGQALPTVKGDAADAIISALSNAEIRSTVRNGDRHYSLSSLSCATPDGSNGDDNFLSPCDYR